MIDFERIVGPNRANGGPNWKTSEKPAERVGDQIPPIITKKFLYSYFDLSPNNCARLYTAVLTTEVLAAIGLNEDQVRVSSFKSFNAVQSRALTQILFKC